MTTIDQRTATAYARALAAARAAHAAGPQQAGRAAQAAVADVTELGELRAVVGALAALAVCGLPAAVRRGERVRSVLDGLAAEVLWRAPAGENDLDPSEIP